MADDAETEFGKRLRASLDSAATIASRKVVDQRFEKFGADVVGWAERAARDAVLSFMAQTVQPFHAGLGRMEGQMQGVEEKLAKHDALLATIDSARLRNDLTELEVARGQLEKSRGDVMAEIRVASSAVSKEADQARRLVEGLLSERADTVSLATVLAARIEAIHGDVAKVAEAAATVATERLKGEVLAEVDTFTETLRGIIGEDLQKFRAESEGVLSRARAAVTASLDAMRKRASADAGLLLARFRGPYEAGESYARGDVAIFQGSTWIAKRAPDGVLPSPDPQGPWALMASGGIGKAK